MSIVKTVLVGLLVVIGVFSAALATLYFNRKPVGNHYIEKALGQGNGCGKIDIRFDPTIVVCRDATIQLGTAGESVWTGTIQKVELQFSPGAGLSDYSFSSVKILRPRILLAEVSGVSSESQTPELPKTPVTIETLKVEDGIFTYQSRNPNNKRKAGELTFSRIAAESQNIEYRGYDSSPIKINITGQLDEGFLSLDMTIKLSKSSSNFEIVSEIENAPLKSANSYTQPTEGLSLQGTIVKARAHSNYSDSRLTTRSSLVYRDLDVDLESQGDSSTLATWFKQVVFNSLLCDSQEPSQFGKQNSEVVMPARKGSWAQYVLTGLLKSSLKVACVEQEVEI